MKLLRAILAASFLSLFTLLVIRQYQPNLPSFENAVLVARKYQLPETSLEDRLEFQYKIHNFLYKAVSLADRYIPLFPSSIIKNFWQEGQVYFFQILPFILLIAFAIALLPKLTVYLIVLFLLFLLPLADLAQTALDSLITKTNFRYLLPTSPKYIWLWSSEPVKPNTITTFSYSWDQKNTSDEALIRVSCLGHYRLSLNGQTLNYGPVFAKFPQNYFDEIPLAKSIKPGKNQINIDCEYLDVKTHEHEIFPYPGLLVGGFIKDSLFKYNLADSRFWNTSLIQSVSFIDRISQDAGFTESVNLNLSPQFDRRTKLLTEALAAQKRPTPFLELSSITPVLREGYYDLGRIMPGYLQIDSDLKDACSISVSYFDSYESGQKVFLENQKDIFILPSGRPSYRQFSRRTGRYLKIDRSGCAGEIKPSFTLVKNSLDYFSPESITGPLDQKIFAISQNSLQNGIQDQIEDSLVREKALYVGDAYAVYQCLPDSPRNFDYMKYILRSFAASQNEDGSLPAMAHSANSFIIPDYTLIWTIFLSDYLKRTNNLFFSLEMSPVSSKVQDWIESNLSEAGFLFDKNKQNWWVFIDWTKQDRRYPFNTALQFYLVQSYIASGKTKEADKLLKNLYQFAYDKKTSLFADSFDGRGGKGSPGIITNALAGKYGLFLDELASAKALKFYSQKNTDSPYSQTWLAEWAMNLGQKELALDIIRRYWGSMVKNGATSVYETYTVGQKEINTSHSHAWGCGPVSLYQMLN